MKAHVLMYLPYDGRMPNEGSLVVVRCTYRNPFRMLFDRARRVFGLAAVGMGER